MQSPPPSSRPTRSLQQIVQMSREFEVHVARELAVNATDLAAMEHLMISGPLAPSELARRLHLTPPAVTASVDRLEALGHATRESNPADRRGVVVTPTAGSVGRAMGILMPMIADIEGALDGFSDDEKRVITDYLDRVIAAYTAHIPE